MHTVGFSQILANFHRMGIQDGSSNGDLKVPSRLTQLFNRILQALHSDKSEKQQLLGKSDHVDQSDNLEVFNLGNMCVAELSGEGVGNSDPSELLLGLSAIPSITGSLAKIGRCWERFRGFKNEGKKEEAQHELKEGVAATLNGAGGALMGASTTGGAIVDMSGTGAVSLTSQQVNILGSVATGIFGVLWIKEMGVAAQKLKDCMKRSAGHESVAHKEVLLEVARLVGSGIMLAATGMGYAVAYGTVL